ncbi:UDP-2,3-diacylglucosamine diphosphatase [Daejeonella sp.]|uniref:UDP-2,3-diacylglucosamine diphosphatase n=1 Tax=Daejeonella sp. TaxID=2805397 RepID=UPI003983C639
MPGTKIYFASDFHLGVPDKTSSRVREDRIVRWLDQIKSDAAEIFLVGDVFDFWFEYETVIPRGFIRFQGKLAELSDLGIGITFFKGNHDMWMFDYFSKELGINIISDELVIERNGLKFYLHHGDGLGPGDKKYKLLKKIFRSKTCQWLFARLHPNLGIAIAQSWSRNSRAHNAEEDAFGNIENEWLYTYSREMLEREHFDFLIFGHRHLPLDLSLGKSRYINLGEWVHFNSYAVFDGKNLVLGYFERDPKTTNLS